MVYHFRPLVWEKVKTKTVASNIPGPRSGHRVACNDSSMFCYGGFSPRRCVGGGSIGRLFYELWEFNFASKKWRRHCGPDTINMPKHVASSSIFLERDYLVVFGGTGYPFGESCSNDCYLFSTKGMCNSITLLNTSGAFPKPSYGQASIIIDNKFYCIGGTTGYDYSCEIHCLDLLNKNWARLFASEENAANQPSGRYRHAVVHYDGFFYLIGGGTSHTVFSLEIIPTYDKASHKWIEIRTKPDNETINHGYPEPRRCHSCVQNKSQAIVAGGCGVDRYFSDVWKLNLLSLQWKLMEKSNLPQPLFFHDACILDNSCMYVFGGVQVNQQMSRTNDLLKIWMDIPKLSEICWDAINFYMPYLSEITVNELMSVGVPKRFCSRLSTFVSCEK